MAQIHPVTRLLEESLEMDRSGEIAAALQRALQAVEIARELNQPAVLAGALAGLAKIHFRLGQYQAAHELADEALAMSAPHTQAHVDALLMLGNCATETDGLAAAEDCFRRAADLSREMGHVLGRFRALHNLGGVYWPRGQFDLALAAYEEAYQVAQAHNLDAWLHFPLTTIPWMYLFTGQYRRARAFLAELDQVAMPQSGARGIYLCLCAALELAEGEPQRALTLYRRALSIGEALGAPDVNIAVRLGLSRYYRAIENWPSAWNWANEAVALAERVRYRHFQAWALVERGRAAWGQQHTDEAEADWQAAIAVAAPLPARFEMAAAHFLLAAMFWQNGREEAGAAWGEAISLILGGGYAFLLEEERSLAFPLLAHHLSSRDPATAAASAALLDQLERVPPPPLCIRTLGNFEVQQLGRTIPAPAWRRRRAGELMRLLLLSPHGSLLTEQVVEALWPGKAPASAQALLHQATSELRQVLEPALPSRFPSRYLVVEQGRVALQLPVDSWVDFQEFARHVAQQEWAAALELYQGDLFPDDRYADWPAVRREQLRQDAVQAAVALARQQLALGQVDEALAACHRALALEPWQEEAVLLGMRACVARNDRAGAIRLYLALERRLAQDLDLAPQPEVQRFYRSL